MILKSPMKLRTKLIYIFSLLFAITSALYVLRIGGDTNKFITNIIYLLFPVLSVAAGFFALSKYNSINAHAKSIFYITLGIFFWMLGEVTWFVFRFLLQVDPYPSLADIFYLIAYPLVFMGLGNELRIGRVGWENMNAFVKLLVVFLSILLIFIVGYFGIYLAYKPSASFLENAIAIGYGVGDVLLIIPTLLILKLATEYKGGKIFSSWLAIFVALVAMLVGDLLFAIYTEQYNAIEWPYNLTDLTWIVSYLCFAYGLSTIGIAVSEIQRKLTSSH